MTILSYSKKFIFIHIPKCGGSSIEEEWEGHQARGDLVVKFEKADKRATTDRRHSIGQHDRLQDLRGNFLIPNFEQFETCALVRNPLKVVESFYTYGARQLDSAARGGATHFPDKGWSIDEWKTFVRDKLASGDTSAAPSFALEIAGGAVRDAMLSQSFDEYLERVGDARWERYMRNYTSLDDREVAVKTVLKLEEPIAIRKYFKVRFYGDFTLLHNNKSGAAVPSTWSKPTRRRFSELTEAEHRAFGYEITD